MTHANTERPTRRAAWPPGVWRPPDRGRLIPYAPSMRPGIRWLIRLRTEHHFHFIL